VNHGDRIYLFRLKYLLFFIAVILIYSFNYHFLWIFYDVAVISLLIYYIRNNKVHFKGYQWFMIIATLWYFVSISIHSGHVFVGLLSTWDTFKHILLFLLLTRMHQNIAPPMQRKFAIRLYHFVFVTILMQVIFVF